MTAVASPNFVSLPPNGWSSVNGDQNGVGAMTSEDVSRILIPRKSLQRQDSGSSLASSSSSSSSASTILASTAPPEGSSDSTSSWLPRKKQARGIWPTSKAEPVSGISTARPQSIAATSGPSAASAISALHVPSAQSQHMVQSQPQQNGVVARPQGQVSNESPAILHLLPMNGTFERKTITVPYHPDVLRIGRQTNQKTVPTPTNGFFDSKVLSRQHAEIWADGNGKIWIRDVKSSNGTFVNGSRLSQENRDSEPHLLREQDVLELGIDIVSEDQKTIVHHKVAARVEHAGIYAPGSNGIDLSFGDLDPAKRAGMLPQPISQNLRRTLSQGSSASGSRFGPGSAGNSNLNLAAYHTKWLQPVTMEQVVKRLGTELKSARLQSQDLRYTANFIETVTNDKRIEGADSGEHNLKASPTRSEMIKSRFSAEPPAPPPSQPLPEKPTNPDIRSRSFDRVAVPSSLRRMETERPLGSQRGFTLSESPPKPESSNQILSLVEALTTAQKELNAQSERVKNLETMLLQEREAREIAEERIRGLETPDDSIILEPRLNGSIHSQTPAILKGDSSTERSISDPGRLQKRLDLMISEMEEMKQHMERYKQRAEIAEDASSKDRKTLSDMVEKLRKEQDERDEKRRKRLEARKARSASSPVNVKPNTSPADEDLSEDDDIDGEIQSPLVKDGLKIVEAQQNGSPLSQDQLQELQRVLSAAFNAKPSNTALISPRSRQEQLAQSAPYASIVGVVLIGWGLMTYLNGWQKAIER